MLPMRNAAFWALDRARQGGEVSKAYRLLKKCDTLNYYDPFICQHQKAALEELLKHAKETTEFYKTVRGGGIGEFPIINKNTIKKNPESFLSTRYKKEDLTEMATSGSTGMPMVVYQDRSKKHRVNAEIIYYGEKAGYHVGKKLICLRSVVRRAKKGMWKQWIQNQPLMNCGDLSDEGLEKMLKELARKTRRSPAVLLAYASTYDSFKGYFQRNGSSLAQTVHLTGIISGSELLGDATRTAMEQAFHCKCISRYSNEENGVLGQDWSEPNVFALNEADYYIEIVKMDEDSPAKEGEVGRIVVTDLYNYAMPLIRYDTGDVGAQTIIEENGVKRRAVGKFGGRRIDLIYDTKNHLISPHGITNGMWSFPEIRQFQFIQTEEKEYEVRINAEKDESMERKIRLMLKKLLGEDARLSVKYVEEIPVLKSGKRKYIVNEMGKNSLF